MNQQQTLKVIHDLNVAGLVGLMEGQGPVWHKALEDLRPEDVDRAVRRIVAHRTSRERWVTPGDVRAAVGDVHHERADAATPELVALMPTNVVEAGTNYEWLSVAQGAMRRGATIDEATTFATGRVLG